jgi:DNA-binding NarL/FixJ family response regulator
VEDGNLAIEEYQKALEEGRPYKVVIMDLTIPGGVGGKEATQKLLKLDPKAKVVVSSGYSTDPVMAHYEEYGFAGILYKPFNLSSLEQIIQVVSQD